MTGLARPHCRAFVRCNSLTVKRSYATRDIRLVVSRARKGDHMTHTVRLTAGEIATVRKHGESQARHWGGRGPFIFEPSERYAMEGEQCQSINIWQLIADRSGLTDGSDLQGMESWAIMRQPLPLSDDGRGLIDIYIAERGPYGNLICNVQAEYDAAGLVRVQADSRERTLWERVRS